MTIAPRSRSVATFARVAGCSHISVCIAGREHHRAARGEQGVGEQVAGQAVGGLGEHVGGGRRDHHQVGALPDPDVGHLVHGLPDVGRHRVAGQGRPGRLADEAERLPRRHDADVVTGLGEEAEQLARLVGGDARAHPEDDTGFATGQASARGD